MVNRRYFLVILDPTGRSVRRVGVSLRAIQIAAGAAIALVVTAAALFLHGMLNVRVAAESETIAHENQLLRKVAGEMDDRLAAGRVLDLRAELTFAQIWSKTGLGLEPSVLGIGPLDDSAEAALHDGSEAVLGPDGESRILSVPPEALPVEFDRLEAEGKALQASLGDMLEYFHDAAQVLSNTPSIMPLTHGFITSSFGRRSDPYNHNLVMHKGLDIGAAIGTEVLAPADGVVIFTGIRGGYGLTLVIDHGYGIQTHYGHLSAIHVKPGQQVQRGEAVAETGSTGRSTGPHLHYEVRRTGQPLNPLRFILD